ncbi:MAG: endonuclease [Alphaproteobacteria bacterium]|nr:MAG: endonuclease [Alphaproteobacteria bacterium]
MPEGPSIYLLREELAGFARKTVRKVSGNSALELSRMQGRRIRSIRCWGKHLLIEFAGFTLRVHLLMFGTYAINARKSGKKARLRLEFETGEISFYSCSLKYLEGAPDDLYDWSADVLADAWSPRRARTNLVADPTRLVCDALLDQTIFAGVGNIIKNEVLYRIKVHPATSIGALPSRKLGQLIKEARDYSFDFLDWKREQSFKRHWLIHTKRVCALCGGPVTKAYLGTTQRRSFYCAHCQVRY